MNPYLFRVANLFVMVAVLFSAATARAGHSDDEFEFKGFIERLPATGFIGDWTVSGRTVHVTSSTRIEQEDGPIAVGAFVEVEGAIRPDGSIGALKVETKRRVRDVGEIELKGTIESFPNAQGFVGEWRVGGRTVHVTSSTRIEEEHGPVAVGAFVEVKGTPRTDGSFDARSIEVKSNVRGGDARGELKGAIESLPNTQGFIGEWRVAGRSVHVTARTVIEQEDGTVAVGAFVEVKGSIRNDGSLDATKIEVKTRAGEDRGGEKVNLKGTIESLPSAQGFIGDWTVSGRTVRVTSSTRIKQEHGAIVVGARVKIKGTQQADGSILASRVQVRDSN